MRHPSLTLQRKWFGRSVLVVSRALLASGPILLRPGATIREVLIEAIIPLKHGDFYDFNMRLWVQQGDGYVPQPPCPFDWAGSLHWISANEVSDPKYPMGLLEWTVHNPGGEPEIKVYRASP